MGITQLEILAKKWQKSRQQSSASECAPKFKSDPTKQGENAHGAPVREMCKSWRRARITPGSSGCIACFQGKLLSKVSQTRLVFCISGDCLSDHAGHCLELSTVIIFIAHICKQYLPAPGLTQNQKSKHISYIILQHLVIIISFTSWHFLFL